jgi:hypothetical protein
LDPKIKVHPASGSGNFPGGVLVKITRKSTAESLAVTEADADKYQLSLTVVADNPNVTPSPEDSIYQYVSLQIPWMQPGESRIVGVPLMPCFNNIPDTCSGDGSTQHLMQATEKCYSADSSWPWVPCTNGGQDHWDFNNPAADGQ